MLRSEAAVSESVGYMLVGFILLLSFVLVYTIGYPIYNSYVESGHMQNIEKSFSILALNGNGVAMQNSPFSSSELKMYGGTLATRDTGYINISYYSDTSGSNLLGYNNSSLTAIEYFKGTDRVAYIDGSVCKATLNGAVMLQEPEFFSNGNMLFIPTIVLYESDVSLAGNTLARITFLTPYYSKMAQTVTTPGLVKYEVYRVSISLSGDYKKCFSDYLQAEFGFTESPGANGELILSKSYPAGINIILPRLYLTVDVN